VGLDWISCQKQKVHIPNLLLDPMLTKLMIRRRVRTSSLTGKAESIPVVIVHEFVGSFRHLSRAGFVCRIE
jgi:hypothetical protein